MADATTEKSAPAKRAGQSGTRKTAAKKTAVKKTAKKTAARTDPRRSSSPPSTGERERGAGPRMAGLAREVLGELLGKTSESVTGIRRTDDGWSVEVEVLELERIPKTTDVLAVYSVDLSSEGDLIGYQRIQRFVRGSAGERS